VKVALQDLISGKTTLDLPKNTMIDVATQTLQLNGIIPTLLNKKVKAANTYYSFPPKLGRRSVLAVRIKTLDSYSSMTEQALSNAVFGGNGDLVNLKSQYSSCSQGKLDMVKTPDRQGITSSIKDGVVTVHVNLPAAAGDLYVSNAVTLELARQFSLSAITQLADHIMYCQPPGVNSGIAHALINGYYSTYDDIWCAAVSAQMHEIGHNLGLDHSGADGNEYGDGSGVMGHSILHSEAPQMCFNAAKNWQLGWFADKVGTIAFAATGTYTWSGRLGSIVNYATSPDPVVIRLPQNVFNGGDIFIGYNAGTGFNAGTLEGKNQVLIFEQGGSSKPFRSDRLGELSVGQTFTIKQFDGNNNMRITITVNIIDASSAHITIASNVPLNWSMPKPTPAPTMPVTSPPTITASPSTSKPTTSPTALPSYSFGEVRTTFPMQLAIPDDVNRLEMFCKGTESVIQKFVKERYGADAETTVMCNVDNNAAIQIAGGARKLQSTKIPVVGLARTYFPNLTNVPDEIEYEVFIEDLMTWDKVATAVAAEIQAEVDEAGAVVAVIDHHVYPPALTVWFDTKLLVADVNGSAGARSGTTRFYLLAALILTNLAY